MTTIIIHELGHYLAFRYYGIKPKIRWRYGAITIGEEQMYALNSHQTIIVGLGGIIFGLITIVAMTNSITLYLIYMIACSFDLTVISTYLETWKDKRTILEIDEEKIQKLKAKL